jgi:hypothetical protein
MTRIEPAASFCVILVAALLSGCGGEKTYNLSGTVSFQGKPVPRGYIVFEPDTSAGNSGAAAFAKIKDGHYDTRIEDGRGTVGGSHLIRIRGFDGIPAGELRDGSLLFPDYNTTADLPKDDGTHDFEVPATAKR